MHPLDSQDETVFNELTEHRGSPPPGEAFELAIEKRILAEYRQNLISIAELSAQVDAEADTIQKLGSIRKKSRSSIPKPRTPILTDHRMDALVRILALQAAADPDVASFRTEILNEELLDIDQVASWVERTAADDGEDGDPTVLITIPYDAIDKNMSIDDPAVNTLPGYREDAQQLHYQTDTEQQPQTAFIRLDGVLGELSTISNRIAQRYDWDEGAAATFILTGVPPSPRGIQARKVEPWPWPKARRSIALDIPLNTAPDEVADLYRRTRDEMLGDEPLGRRSLTKRSADLAVFAAEHSTGHTWTEARHIWNGQHKDKTDRYADSARFTRASRTAYKRITGKNLDWIGKASDDTPVPSEPKET